jgi:hypothetical protein
MQSDGSDGYGMTGMTALQEVKTSPLLYRSILLREHGQRSTFLIRDASCHRKARGHSNSHCISVQGTIAFLIISTAGFRVLDGRLQS